MSPTPRAALALVGLALAALVVPLWLVALATVALAGATIADARAVRRAPAFDRRLPAILSRGVSAPLRIVADLPEASRRRLRQAAPPDLCVEPAEADGELDAALVARRRGRHTLPGVAGRFEGPLGLGAWHHRSAREAQLLVYPDMPAARRLSMAVRHGRFRDPGRLTRGPLGFGTEFESIREYLPDDDIRQVNWRATARVGRPMSNQYRVEQDRDVVCVIDAGRLMAAPLGDLTRLDAAIDAAVAVALVADEVGDRCGAVAFDAQVRVLLRPRRSGGQVVVRGLFDLEPTSIDSDYELAFRTIDNAKRSLMMVFVDLLEDAAAKPLIEAVPVLARRHHVVVASSADAELEAFVRTPPERESDVYAAAVALDVLGARQRVARQLRSVGADVLEAPPGKLAGACVRSYLRAKARARL